MDKKLIVAGIVGVAAIAGFILLRSKKAGAAAPSPSTGTPSYTPPSGGGGGTYQPPEGGGGGAPPTSPGAPHRIVPMVLNWG